MLLRVRSVPVLAIVFASVFFDTNLSDAEDAIPPLFSVAEKRAWEGGQEFQRGAKLARRFTPQGELRADAESSLTLAQVASGTRLSEHELAQEHVIVTGYEVNPVEYPSLPQVEGTRINAGKKSSFVRPDEFPTITNNNFRQALATTPGLLVSEEANSPIINIGYRGLDSQRSENTQVLKDGISIKNEQFGFPESHYVPSLDSIERIEVLRGGASLQYGSQPGGAVNFVTWMPRTDRPFHLSTKNVFGSFDLFTSYTAIDGTVGAIGYYGFYDHREREGFREANSDYDLDAGSLKAIYETSASSRFILTLDIYDEEHGEPGGLQLTPAPNAVLYQLDREASSRFFDRFRLERQYATLEYQKEFSERTEMTIKAFGGYLARYSRRQRGGGFGTLPSGEAASTNSIQLREVYNEGAEARLRQDYDLLGNSHSFAGGVYFYHAEQQRTDRRGLAPDAQSGVLRNRNIAETYNGAIFAENVFHFDRLSITPGMRLEFIEQAVDESFNISKMEAGTPLAADSQFSFVPLFGFGISYELLTDESRTTSAAYDGKGAARKPPSLPEGGAPRLELYGNVSQAYRPKTYEAALPTGPTQFVTGDLKEGDSLQFELGLRGRILPYLTLEISGFYFTFDNQVGTVSFSNGTSTVTNVGGARHYGAEASFELDVLALANGGEHSPLGALALYGNATLLNARFTSGPNDGLRPAYAPDYQFKTGLLYRYKDVVKVGFIGTIVDDHYADANNAAERFIPAYMTWDLTMQAKFWNGRFGVVGGINNLFNEDHWARVRDEGIDPAPGRNYYGGFTVSF